MHWSFEQGWESLRYQNFNLTLSSVAYILQITATFMDIDVLCCIIRMSSADEISKYTIWFQSSMQVI